jgi:hypothetical protein
MPDLATTSTAPAPPPSSYTSPPTSSRPDAISDARYRQLEAGERAKFTNIRGADGGQWIETAKLSAEPTDTTKPASTNGTPVVTPEGYLRVEEMVLSPQDVQNLMQTRAEADIRKTQIPANAESYEVKLPEGFRLPDGMAFQLHWLFRLNKLAGSFTRSSHLALGSALPRQ